MIYSPAQAQYLISKASLVFWDFDGVIKDSVEAKSLAFQQLFNPFGKHIVSRITKHHEENGGISRFEKIPLYLSWSGEPATKDQIDLFCERFSRIVFTTVISSPWVPGVKDYLIQNHLRQINVLVTATPQIEITQILLSLGIDSLFFEIFGAPQKKDFSLSLTLDKT